MSESPAFSAALRRIDPTKNMARFYAVGVQLTLFGEWAVVKRWGRINTEGRRAEEWFAERDEALSAAKSQEAAKRVRGYVSVGK
ncbi:MAG: WGR domain-containing protein [Caulobacteraceae bacterium]